MKTLRETLWEKLLNRLPANDAVRASRVLKRAGCLKEIDYMAVKALSELVEAYEAEARGAIRDYRKWCVAQEVQRFTAVIRHREGELLHRNARDKVNLYVETKRDYEDLVELAMRPYRTAANDDSDQAETA